MYGERHWRKILIPLLIVFLLHAIGALDLIRFW